jgi:hypothetical protein
MQKWFVQSGDKILGPLNSAELKSLATTGQINESTQVAQQESGPWRNAARIRGLFTANPPNMQAPTTATVPPNPMPAAQQSPPTETARQPKPVEEIGTLPSSTALSRLQKTFPMASLTRSGGDVIVSVGAAGSLWHGDRWTFSITARTDKKGEIKATIEYGPDKDSPKRTRARRAIADFSEENVGQLACQMVDLKIRQTGSTVWKTIVRRVDYAAIIRVNYAGVSSQGDAYVVSLQKRQMRLDSSSFAPEPCTAEVTRGRKLWETTAKGLGIDDAYDALDRVLNELICGDDDEDDDDDNF